MPKPQANRAPLLVSRALATRLLRLYDYPHPHHRGRMIRGYDCPHALRTARMCAAVAQRLGHGPERVRQYQIACLLHDLGRAGLDRRLFGRIWSWARSHGVPTRPREWRARHPKTPYGRETEAFLRLHKAALEAEGICMDRWGCEQVEMRLGYARRLARCLKTVKPSLRDLGVIWSGWMGTVMLYYYYPEKLARSRPWVKQLGEVLVACEQFEAYSNQRRGRDYYVRKQEKLSDAFAYLDELKREDILSAAVVEALRGLTAEGAFDAVLEEARGRAITGGERRLLRQMTGG